jgi:iron(III) transport system permease protein
MTTRAGTTISLAILGFIFVGYVAYPLASLVSGSVEVGGELSFRHYQTVLDVSNKANMEAVWNSVSVSLLSVLLSGILGIFFAFVFTQFAFPFKQLFSRLAIMPIALPPLVGVLAFLFVFGESGFVPRLLQYILGLDRVPFYIDGIGAVVLVHVYSFYVYFYLFVSTAFRQIDASLVEAAATFGSSPWNTFRRVVLPGLRPAIFGAGIITFMTSMASFSAPFIFGGGARFLTTQIYSTKLNGELELAAAQSVLLTLVSLGVFLFFIHSERTASATGATKGAVRWKPMLVGTPARVLMLVVTFAVLLVELLPLLAIVIISFVKEGTWTWQILPTAYTLENYGRLVGDPHILDPVKNSLVMTVLTVGAAAAVGVPAAYFITKGGWRKTGRFADVLLSAPYAVPGTVIAIGLILAFNSPSVFTLQSVLVGSFWILPLAYFVRTYPLMIRSTRAALERLDDSLLEAAQSFGAGIIKRFVRVTLPIILPGIVSGCLLVFIASVGEFVSSILLYTYNSRPISIEILSQLRGYNFGAAAAYSVVLLFLIFGASVLAEKAQQSSIPS